MKIHFCQILGKPKPDIFLRAAELIGFKGREHEILVFEVFLSFFFLRTRNQITNNHEKKKFRFGSK